MEITRRRFLQVGLSGLAYFTTEWTAPNWIIRSAGALECLPGDKILVIVQQAGGNDGLNTVIPRMDPVYYDAATRPTIAVPPGAEINLDGLNGFHPRLAKLADWYQKGKLGVLQNVGYLNPNLSHFTATDYYEFGVSTGQTIPQQGWVARFYDNACAGADDPDALLMVGSGISTVPDAMEGMTGYTPPAISSAAAYQLLASSDPELRLPAITALNSGPAINSHIDFLQRSESVAEASAADVATAVAQPDLVPEGSYPEGSFGEGLRLVSQIIRAGFQTKIFYVSQGGYDTHANQIQSADPLNVGDHPELLAVFDQALDAFLTEMELSGNLDRVLVMSFSEFGRRVAENSSFGTDHGAANCSFVIGGQVKGGVYGGQPDLVNLIKGNLNYEVDFRSVYSRVIQDWFGGQAAPVFGEDIYQSIIEPDLPKIDFLVSHSRVRAPWRKYQ